MHADYRIVYAGNTSTESIPESFQCRQLEGNEKPCLITKWQFAND